jgi:CDP-paratose 2-epimerase|tara:strand:+ start:2663 stop:3691 length:1029 start_codon:yes stop_codon:yes gene_type:complete
MNKKILITGGCGFIGTNLSLYLKKKKHNVFTLDNLSRNGSKYNLDLLKKNKITNYKIDITNSKKISLLPKFDLIIDCCAEAAVEVSKKDINRVIETNLIGTINILNKIRKDQSKLIFLSSSRVNSIYAINNIVKKKILKKKPKSTILINENFDTRSPKSIYGLTKHASEMFIEEFSYAFNLKYIINRFGVIAGPLQFGKEDQGFVSLWTWCHLKKNNLKYIGYGGFGNQVRDVLHVQDLCEIIELQIKNMKSINNHIFTIGGSKKNTISLNDLTAICQKITKNKISFKKIKKTSQYDIPYFITDNQKISKMYKWKPKKNIIDIVNDTYKWMVNQKTILNKYI